MYKKSCIFLSLLGLCLLGLSSYSYAGKTVTAKCFRGGGSGWGPIVYSQHKGKNVPSCACPKGYDWVVGGKIACTKGFKPTLSASSASIQIKGKTGFHKGWMGLCRNASGQKPRRENYTYVTAYCKKLPKGAKSAKCFRGGGSGWGAIVYSKYKGKRVATCPCPKGYGKTIGGAVRCLSGFGVTLSKKTKGIPASGRSGQNGWMGACRNEKGRAPRRENYTYITAYCVKLSLPQYHSKAKCFRGGGSGWGAIVYSKYKGKQVATCPCPKGQKAVHGQVKCLKGFHVKKSKRLGKDRWMGVCRDDKGRAPRRENYTYITTYCSK